ncbi:extracellular serine-rich protein [Venturia nashicola]|uniref:Extracellular serine-rich protein n=1 Tax=Venturia nashicola TaxID=86259 RepID=A0A4Z1PMW1_9PEZI|nr:extracellular serine-rich protein [Venturia nashicola]
MRTILALLAFVSVALAHHDHILVPGNSSTATTSAPSPLQTITVGKDGSNRFDPESLEVTPGSKVVFEFYPGHNSVVQGSFDKPCSPQSNVAFYSGYVDSVSGPASQIFTISVDNPDPIWFYSGSASHCQQGMVGVINPSQNQTLAAYRSGASTAPNTTLPASNIVQGGVLNSTTTSASVGTATAKGEAGRGTVSVFGVVVGLVVWLFVVGF